MSYMISYGTDGVSRFTRVTRKTKRKIYVAITVFLMMFAVLFPQVRQWIRKAVFPGNPDVTQEAVSQMISDIHDGAAVKDAVTTFCQEILDYAGQ